jgi:hypothetical protein
MSGRKRMSAGYETVTHKYIVPASRLNGDIMIGMNGVTGPTHRLRASIQPTNKQETNVLEVCVYNGTWRANVERLNVRLHKDYRKEKILQGKQG